MTPAKFQVPPPPPPRRKRMAAEWVAFGLSLVWLTMIVVAFRLLGRQGMQMSDTLGLIVIALAVFLPIAVIWLSVLVLRAAQQMRNESRRLHLTVEGMRRGWIRDQQASGKALKPTVLDMLGDIAQAQRKTEDQLAMFVTTRNRPPLRRPGLQDIDDLPQGENAQPVLALENPLPPAKPLAPGDVIRALHFPENEHDEAGFAALRRALEDHATADLIQAAQDVLTALSSEGIYMEDLHPDRARPEVWRAFATGMRGVEISALGGIRDRSCLALTTARMRSDLVFRDAAHRFLRSFDKQFARFEEQATDAEIARFAETRSARAFMLLGRVTGIFG